MTSTVTSVRRRLFRSNPPRVVAVLFAVLVLIGTLVLSLPFATRAGRDTSFVDALFTATSAVCVTGLTVVDTATHWSVGGQVAILGMIQLGGLGIMTLASSVVLILNRRMDIASRMATSAETGSANLELRPLLFGILRFTLAIEAIGATILTLRFATLGELSIAQSAWHGVFHSISAFNNAGFGLRSDNLMPYVGDWVINGTVGALVVLGGLGFPVLLELERRLRIPRPRRPRLSLHARITLWATAALLVGGTVALCITEWTNPDTLGPLSTPNSILAAAFQSVQTRTAGFNSIDIGAMNTASWLIMSILMFIGGGPGSTAGGIKVTTFTIIALMLWAEIRGEADVTAFKRRLSSASSVKRSRSWPSLSERWSPVASC